MTPSTTDTQESSDAFLNGQGIPVDPRDIESELSRLWGPAAERVGGPELTNPHVTRIVLANLVVLDTVTARFPARTIVLQRTDNPDRKIDAEVSALCHLPAPGLPQVCSERIVLRAGPRATDLLPGAVRPLLEADLPFVLWWTDDPRQDEALFRNLADECSRLILDLPDPGADLAAIRLGLDPTINAYSRDAAWFGLTRWRELIAQFFDPPCHLDILKRLDSVRIEVKSPTEETPRLAIWLAAWLAGQLNWKPQGRPDRSGGQLSATFQGPPGRIDITIVTAPDPSLGSAQLLATTLTAKAAGGRETFALHRRAAGSPEVHVEIDSADYCTLPRVVLAPDLDAPRRLAAALESSRNDPPFQHALPIALWLMEPS